MNPPDQLIDDLRLLEPPEPFRLNLWLVVAVLALLAFAWWFHRWRRAIRNARTQVKAIHQAHDDALAELERLFALIDREESRPYALASSAIIRRYIETRFGVSAPRRSTEEFLIEAQRSPRLEPHHRELLGGFLPICDLLKFARTRADRAELQKLHEAAVRFVKETRHAPAIA